MKYYVHSTFILRLISFTSKQKIFPCHEIHIGRNCDESSVAHRWFVKRSYSPRHLYSTFVRHIVYLLFLLSLALFFFSFFSYHFVPQSASSLESLIDGKALKRKKIYLLFQTPGELKILFRIINKRNVPNGSRKTFYYYIRFISFVNKNYIGIIYSKKKENKFIQIIK